VFPYDDDRREEENGAIAADGDKDNDWFLDTCALPPKSKRYALFPHMVAQVVEHNENNSGSSSSSKQQQQQQQQQSVFLIVLT
jgi:hypothetical protein